jgi:uncharacterized BrkB/YihY/UPF0761 family membrane protein
MDMLTLFFISFIYYFLCAKYINHMWILIGAWIYSMIWIIGTDNNQYS